jgi:hypothetical protein
MRDTGSVRRRRIVITGLALCAAWLVLQNTLLLALLVWVKPLGAATALVSILRYGSVAAAVSVLMLGAMTVGGLIVFGATRRRAWAGVAGREVRHAR